MADVVVTPAQLGTYLASTNINVERAQMMLDDTIVLVRPFFAPNDVPVEASGVIRRVAGRGYVTTVQSRTPQLDASGSPFAGGFGGVWLTRQDRDDLADIAASVYPTGSTGGGGGAFTVNMLPAGYALPAANYAIGDWDLIP